MKVSTILTESTFTFMPVLVVCEADLNTPRKPTLAEGVDDIIKKYNITQRGPESTGLDVDKGIWYGWSHRALHGFKVGDKLFDENYKDGDKDMDNVKFTDRGSKTCKTLDDCKQAAVNFSRYVS